MQISRPMLIAVVGVVIVAIGWYVSRPAEQAEPDGADSGPMVSVTLPASFSSKAQQGQVYFEETCAACHGTNAAGSGSGPPLIHKIYEPGHHADGSFQLAAMRGVRSHHWNFGDMPALPEVTADQLAYIVAYVRELQRANGIE